MIDISENDIDEFYTLWMFWRATGKRFLPSQLLNEPLRPLEVMLTLDGLLSKIEQQKREREDE